MAIKIKWSSLLNLDELEFIPEPPRSLEIDDKLLQSISWMTAATRHNRKLLRCDDNGALLVTQAWNGLNSVETVEVEPTFNSPVNYNPTAEHKGILVTSNSVLCKLSFTRIDSPDIEHTFIPPYSYYWYPHPCTLIRISLVPIDGDADSFLGLTAFN